MPKKQANKAKKFDPRADQATNPVKTPDTKPVEPTEPAQKTEQSVEAKQPDVLSLIGKLTEQITALTTQNSTLAKEVSKLSDNQTKMEDNVEEFKKETSEQRVMNLAKAKASRESKMTIIKKLWNNQTKVQMLVPPGDGRKKGDRYPVQAQGYKYVHTDGREGIPVALYTAIPKGVFDIASESLNQQIENMGFDNRVDQRATTSEGAKFDPERLNR